MFGWSFVFFFMMGRRGCSGAMLSLLLDISGNFVLKLPTRELSSSKYMEALSSLNTDPKDSSKKAPWREGDALLERLFGPGAVMARSTGLGLEAAAALLC